MFKSLTLKNFRNFENIYIELKDKNIILGMNDVGKSNLLHSLRMIFDRKIRLDEIHSSDFHNKNMGSAIEIIVGLDISHFDGDDVEKLIAKVQEARTQEESQNFYIKLKIDNKEDEGALKQFYWGDDLDNLRENRYLKVTVEKMTDKKTITIPKYTGVMKFQYAQSK